MYRYLHRFRCGCIYRCFYRCRYTPLPPVYVTVYRYSPVTLPLPLLLPFPLLAVTCTGSVTVTFTVAFTVAFTVTFTVPVSVTVTVTAIVRTQVDGCAIFWRRAKFRLAENYTVEFNECARRAVSAMPGLPPDDGHHFLMRVSKDNVAQV